MKTRIYKKNLFSLKTFKNKIKKFNFYKKIISNKIILQFIYYET